MRSASLVRMPGSTAQRKLFFKLRETRRALEQRTGAEVTSQQLATELSVDVQNIDEASARLAARDASLDFQERAPARFAMLLSTDASQEQALGDKELEALRHSWLEHAMRSLDDRERITISSRYLADEPQTLAEVGKRFSVSRERVRQLETKAFGKLRSRLLAAPTELREAV